jgi:threonine/homoserine/homoserine lactone efflux protein
MIDILLPFVTAILALLIVPGPDMALVVANGAAYGKKGAFFSSLGISSGGMILALVTAIIVATAVSINSGLLTVIQIIGCVYLLYIAVVTLYPKSSGDAEKNDAEPTKGNLFFRGVITNISNPKALIFFTAFIPQFIPEATTNPAIFAFALGTLLCAIGFGVNFAFGVTGSMFSGLSRIAFAGRTWSQWIIFIVFFTISLIFAVQLLFS